MEIKLLVGILDVNQVILYTSALYPILLEVLTRAEVKLFVHLAGVKADDLAIEGCSETASHTRFSAGSWAKYRQTIILVGQHEGSF